MLQEDNDKLDVVIDLIKLVLQRLSQIDPNEEIIFLTIVETASMFNVSERTIKRWQTDGFIKGFYIGGSMYFSKKELLQAAVANKINRK